MSVVQLTDVGKSYQSGPTTLTVLQDISVAIEPGSVTVIRGVSGSGKSTLLNLVGGLDRPTTGTIISAGYRIDRLNEDQLTEYRSSVLGFVFQFHYLLKDFTALENVMLPAFMRGEPRDQAIARAAELLDEVGLADRADHYPTELSGGERQRAAVARALVNTPSLVLADEPTGNLDAANSANVERILLELVRRHGATLVIVTHEVDFAAAADRQLVLDATGLRPA